MSLQGMQQKNIEQSSEGELGLKDKEYKGNRSHIQLGILRIEGCLNTQIAQIVYEASFDVDRAARKVSKVYRAFVSARFGSNLVEQRPFTKSLC